LTSSGDTGFRVFRGRRLGPLIGPWLSSAIFAAIVYYVDYTIPALHEVAAIIYWFLLAIVAVATARWLRVRSHDRREKTDAGHARKTRARKLRAGGAQGSKLLRRHE